MERPVFRDLVRFVIRHRFTIRDFLLVAASVGVAGFLLFEFDIFLSHGQHTPAQQALELDEVIILSAILTVGLLWFSWRLNRKQKKETDRRLEAERHVHELAYQDPLTGLPNRRRFGTALKVAVASPPRAGSSHCVLMMDLHSFKQINDVYGHPVGDEVLAVVAERLLSAVRGGDLVARLGGDEFAVLAEHLASPEAATNIARRILDNLSEPITAGGVLHQAEIGIGACLFPFEGNNADEVIRRADIALYRTKQDRRHTIQFFDQDMDKHVREREILERRLRAAVTAGSVRPFFQPLVDLKSKQVVGFEALARWTDSELGEVPPDRFIPVAEDSGLIHQLTDQLFTAACKAAREWPAHVTLAFNISPSQLRDRTLGLRLLAIMAKTGITPSRVEIEITESALVRDLEAAQEVLGALREAGVRIALDDFGTGYSSLYHLRNFKLDKIKIDRSFVAAMRSEKESAEIVQALIGLGNGLGLTITAEGIEEGDQEDDLIAAGCQQGQGFLFSKAVEAHEARQFFAEDASAGHKAVA